MITVNTDGPRGPYIDYDVDDHLSHAMEMAARVGFEIALGSRAERLSPSRFRLPLRVATPWPPARAEASDEDLARIAAAIESTFAIQSAAAPWSRDFGPIEREQLGRLARDVAANAAMVIGEMLYATDPSIAIGRGRR